MGQLLILLFVSRRRLLSPNLSTSTSALNVPRPPMDFVTPPSAQNATTKPKSTGNIKKNEFILPLHGEIITKSELERRKEIYSKCGENHLYPFQAGNYVIDTTRKGNSARFANHSCEPNLIAKRWIINNRKKGFRAIGFVALKNIAKNSELTFDYEYDYNPYVFSRKKKLFNATLFFRKTSQRCLCGTKTCKGWIGTPPPDVGPADEKKTSGSL
ncbi:Protein CBG16769 [Caenorhabditis briggsae]|uniref:Protein CBG16769 n=1 Tax=Caenorhabditis briggsae TaxID=6238 RepID=A8XPS3_CAEBR|nr:Protein CBG16769 [Caenorhabditis briggsae]CAP34649.2 Protein CBG16769 [Caenorhabditis briggsae]